MKVLGAFLIFLLHYASCFGQDGSDIKYVPIKNLDNSFIGKFAHLDFNRKSFHSRNIDTIIIKIDKIPVRFQEHRVDNGFNNWFSQQYLISLDKVDGYFVKLTKCKIARITKDSILVINYLEHYDIDMQNAKRLRQLAYWFKKEDIIEVLVEFH
jgi:hypothetical protein